MSTFSAHEEPLAAGTTLVEASAGTGKTYAITRLVVRLLLEGHVAELPQILVLTYTTAAAGELAGRLRSTLAAALAVAQGTTSEPQDLAVIVERAGADAERRLRQALIRCDELAVGTIHGFCLQALEAGAFDARLSFTAEFLAEDDPVLDQAAADAWRLSIYADPLAAAVALAMRRSPAGLRREVADVRRAGTVQLRPDPQPLATTLAAVRTAASAVAATIDADFNAAITGGTWKADSAIKLHGAEAVVRDIAAIADCTAAALASACRCTAEAIQEGHYKKPAPPQHPAFAACSALAQAVERAAVALRAEQIALALTRFEHAKREADVLGFDDLLTRLRTAVLDPDTGPRLCARLRARWPVVLVDEFQDTDPVQCAILSAVWPAGPRWLIGDPKQAIYAFRGADLHAYLTAAAAADRRRSLSINQRSTTPLVDAVNAVFAGANPFLEPGIVYHPVVAAGRVDSEAFIAADSDAPLTWWLADDEASLIDVTVATLRRLIGNAHIGDRPLRAADCAVLTRTNRQGDLVRRALLRVGIPAATGGGGDVLTCREADELATVLAAVLDPGVPQRLRAACATRLIGMDAATVAALAADDAAWLVQAERFHAWQLRMRRDGIHALVEHLLTGEGLAANLLARGDGERSVTNLRHVAELLHEAAQERHLAPRSLLTWMAQARSSTAIPRDRRELRLESDADAVQILTIHRAKGLEFPVVCCPWLGRAPRPRQPAQAYGAEGIVELAWEPDADLAARSLHEGLAEDLRLLYVALTRASHRCYAGIDRHTSLGASAIAHLVGATGGNADAVHAAITELAQQPGHAVCVVTPAAVTPEAITPVTEPAISVRELRLPGHQLVVRPTASFTGLVHHAHEDASARDHADPGLPVTAVTAGAADGLDALPAGARFGTVLHHLLERLDWTQPVPETAVSALMRSAALASEQTQALTTALEHLRTLPWPHSGLRLAQLTRIQQWCEWSFHLPLAGIAGDLLADVCAEHGDEALRAYAPRLRQLDPRAARGFLTGSIDLVAEHDGRWWIADWKSNRLSGYDRATLTAAMHEHHYVLQALLYQLAVHRHLRARLPDYNPERHLGGVAYVFVRGLGSPSEGFWTARIPVALIDAVDALLVTPAVDATEASS